MSVRPSNGRRLGTTNLLLVVLITFTLLNWGVWRFFGPRPVAIAKRQARVPPVPPNTPFPVLAEVRTLVPASTVPPVVATEEPTSPPETPVPTTRAPTPFPTPIPTQVPVPSTTQQQAGVHSPPGTNAPPIQAHHSNATLDDPELQRLRGICGDRVQEAADKAQRVADGSGQDEEPEDGYFKDPNLNRTTYLTALELYYSNLLGKHKKRANDITDDFTDVHELPDHGVLLPHNPQHAAEHEQRQKNDGVLSAPNSADLWRACDQGDTDFTDDRDAKCMQYLSDLNNLQSIKAMTSELYNGRTIKFKLYYRHNNISAIVKVPQEKFLYEAASEFLAYNVDRVLNFSHVPTSVLFHIPIDYMRAAAGILSPFYSTWFEKFVPRYYGTKAQFRTVAVPEDPEICAAFIPGGGGEYAEVPPETRKRWGPVIGAGVQSSPVLVQLWMYDVHPAGFTSLQMRGGHKFPKRFLSKWYSPDHSTDGGRVKKPKHHRKTKAPTPTPEVQGPTVSPDNWPPNVKPYDMKAASDVNDRMIFDYLLGNTDRGMNDHNNFVYGGCGVPGGYCKKPPEGLRTKREAKYAFLDHGSAFYSRGEPGDNPLSGSINNSIVCRFKQSTYNYLARYRSETKIPAPTLSPAEEQKHHHHHHHSLIWNPLHAMENNEEFPYNEGTPKTNPMVDAVNARVNGKGVYNFLSKSTFKQAQKRLNKVLWLMDRCVFKYGKEKVFTLID